MPTRIEDNPTVLDDAFLLMSKSEDSADAETYEFSDVSTSIKPMVEFGTIPVGPTFGRKVRIQKVTDSYSGTLAITFRTNGFAASDVDRIIGDFCHPPEGKGNGEVFLRYRPFSDPVSSENPERKGTYSFPTWEPFGSGDNETIVEQTITFTLAKDDYKRYYSIDPAIFQQQGEISKDDLGANGSLDINLGGAFTAKDELTYFVDDETMVSSGSLKTDITSSFSGTNIKGEITTKRRIPTLKLTASGARSADITIYVVARSATDKAKFIEMSFKLAKTT